MTPERYAQLCEHARLGAHAVATLADVDGLRAAIDAAQVEVRRLTEERDALARSAIAPVFLSADGRKCRYCEEPATTTAMVESLMDPARKYALSWCDSVICCVRAGVDARPVR